MKSIEACKQKVRYSESEAKRQSYLRNLKHGKNGSYYHCEHCGAYHLTSHETNYIHESTWNKIKKQRRAYYADQRRETRESNA